MVLLTEQIIKGKTRLDKLEEVKNLNLWGQDLTDVSVLAKVPNLEVLSLSVNRLSTLKDFRHCARLQELYLRKNDVRDLSELQHLAGLKDLKVLWLSDNPCAEHPQYRQTVARTLPQLQKLDNDDVAALQLDAAPPAPPARSGSASAPAPPPSAGPSPYGAPYGGGAGSPYGADGYGDRGGSGGASPDQAYGGGRPATAAGGGGGGGGGMGGGEPRSTKNILYAVMALLGELEVEDLVYVRREIEQRLAGR